MRGLWPNGLHSIWFTTGSSPVSIHQLFDLFDRVVAHADVARQALALRAPQALPQHFAHTVIRRAMNEHEVRVSSRSSARFLRTAS